MKFSILIPAFKKRFLSEAIESILAQTYENFELIIVNDHSPEDLDSVVSSFHDKRISYYVNEKNCGAINVVDNWNICLRYSTGDYVICMGDDDKLLPDCLQNYYDLISKYPHLGVYHTRTLIINENSDIIDIQEPRPIYENIYSMIYNRLNGRMQYIGDFLFDVKLLRENGGFYKLPLAWSSDDISVYIAAQDTGIANMQQCGFSYRVSSLTISKGGYIKEKFEALKLEENWYKGLIKNHKPVNLEESIYYDKLKKKTNLLQKKKVFLLEEKLIAKGFLYFTILLVTKKKYGVTFIECILAIALYLKRMIKSKP